MNSPYKNEREKQQYFDYINLCMRYNMLIQRYDDMKISGYYNGEHTGNSLTSTIRPSESGYMKLGKEIEAQLIRDERNAKLSRIKTEMDSCWESIQSNIYFKRLPIKITRYNENLLF